PLRRGGGRATRAGAARARVLRVRVDVARGPHHDAAAGGGRAVTGGPADAPGARRVAHRHAAGAVPRPVPPRARARPRVAGRGRARRRHPVAVGGRLSSGAWLLAARRGGAGARVHRHRARGGRARSLGGEACAAGLAARAALLQRDRPPGARRVAVRRGCQERPPRAGRRARVHGAGARGTGANRQVRGGALRDRDDPGDVRGDCGLRNAEWKGERRGRMHEHHLSVSRTARYFTLGERSAAEAEVGFACHGYGQLAARFLEKLRVLDDGTRYLVAPEGLSRFYLSESPTERRVGASWMTREDRLAEIADYVQYLDAVYQEVFGLLDRSQVTVHALGFSQGVATA